MQREFVSVRVGVMMVSDAPTTLDEATVKSIVDRLTTAGHTVEPVEVIKDDPALVRAQLEVWIRDAEMDVVIGLAGFESDAMPTALAPLITKQVAGFSEMFRVLTYNEIGTAAMLTDVIAAQCGTTFVFVLPASKGAVATAVHKLLIPQLDARTMPRNLVMRMPRHRSPSGAFETSGPMAFPKEDTAPASVPPPPRAAKSSMSPPPPPPKKRLSGTHSTPPMPLAVVVPPADIGAKSDPSMEIDPAMMIEDPVNRTLEEALEKSIEDAIETSGKALLETPKLDDDHPSMVAAREHAEKTPEAQAAAWVQAVEIAATKAQQKAAAEREEREAREAKKPESVPEAVDEVDESEVVEDQPEEQKAVGSNDEPRGKIEKASGKPASKPDRAVKDEDAVIVEDPDLVAAERRLRPSMQPANKKKEPEMPLLLIPRVKEPEVPVFGAREMPPHQKTNRGWMLIGGIAVIAAVVLIVLALGKRDGTSAAATDPNVGQLPNPPPAGPTAPAGNPPVDPNANPNAVDLPGSNSDIEMEPQTHVTDPKPNTPKPPRPPRGSEDPKNPNPDDPDLTKAPTNPTTADECDEVTCILNKFNKPCCERYKPADWKPPVAPGSDATTPNTPKAPDNAGPIELDKTLIRVGVERFRAQVIACGEQSQAKGTVKIDVSVRPDGMVDSASVAEAPDPVLGNCVAGVMRKATFAKTQKGGTFSYPFVF